MQYAISNIHGCYTRFLALLEKIAFSDSDTLYVLGDSLDRGRQTVPLLRDLSVRANVYHLAGDHEYLAIRCLRALGGAGSDGHAHLDNDESTAILNWMADGGEPTAKGFAALSGPERAGLLDYLEEMLPYDVAVAGGNKFVLVHAGLSNFRPDRPLDSYRVDELVFDAPDYGRRYFEDAYLVTGHVQTRLISPDGRDRIFRNRKNHIAIDCGASCGGSLACLCLDTMEEFYA